MGPADPSPGKRPRCPACQRPTASCICPAIRTVRADCALLILQHPLEVQQAKGSARLLQLCVPGSVMLTGETFDHAVLDAALTAGGRRPILLYPADPADPGPVLNAGDLHGQGPGVRLVVLDATWRKSRKMLYLNPQLATLPRLALSGLPPSNYRIRKAHAPGQLSSFEAAAHALMGLQEDGAAGLAKLLAAFDDFVTQQAAFDPTRALPAAN